MELLVRNRIFRPHTIRNLGGRRCYTYRNNDFRIHSWLRCKQACANYKPMALLHNRQQTSVPVCIASTFPTRNISTVFTPGARSDMLIADNYGISSTDDKTLLRNSLQQFGILFTKQQQRSLSVTVTRFSGGDKSKVEQTVKALKDQPIQKKVHKPIWRRVWDEIVHTYHGFRLLFIDMKVTLGLIFRLMRGHTLSRREHRLFVRTTADVFRLIPFSVFVIVPFMELALPLYIKFFPNMLPSTFQTKDDKISKLKNSMKIKLEVAKFLQESLEEIPMQSPGSRSSETAKDFKDFFKRIRTSGQTPSNAEILRFSKVFADDLTIDNLPRGHLIALCRLLELHSIGPNSFLTFQLRMALRNIKADDVMIHKEGVKALTVWELQQAMKSRGMRSMGLSETQMREQLNHWLDLSTREDISPSLLLLSRAMSSADDVPAVDQIASTISQLPETLGTELEAKIGEMEGKVDNKIRVQLIKEEQKRIKEERKERDRLAKETLVDKAPFIDPLAPKDQISEKEIDAIEGALDQISADKKKLIIEKEELQDLKEEMKEYKEDLDELSDVKRQMGRSPKELRETKAARRLYNRLNKMIGKMDGAIAKAETEKTAIKERVDKGTAGKEELVSITELLGAMRKLQTTPNEARMGKIEDVLARMDIDKDGNIKVDDVVKVFQVLGHEQTSLTPEQMKNIVEMLEKEESLEAMEKGANP